MDFEVLKRVIAALEARGVEYAIFGAIAMTLHGLVRATEDLDLFVAPDLETQRVPVDGLTATVVTPRMLYRMKKGTVRLKDRADAEMLRRQFKLESD